MSDNQNYKEIAQLIGQNKGFEIQECPEIPDIDKRKEYTKLDSFENDYGQMNLVLSQFPALWAAETLSEAYICRFPTGVFGSLTKLNQGGYGSMLRNANGQFVGSASFFPIEKVAATELAILNTFSLMSVVTGQYFLSKINSDLRMLQGNVDKILEFLYGDKKAELLSEASFVRYAYENYAAIMSRPEQRLATIVSLQNTRKIAMQDIEFYLRDLNTVAEGDRKGDELVQVSEQIRTSLEFSLQLYAMSSVMEAYFAQNSDKNYLAYIENSIVQCINRCERKINNSYSMIKTKLLTDQNSNINKLAGKFIKTSSEGAMSAVEKVLSRYEDGTDSELKESTGRALQSIRCPAEYYITKKGDIYIKTA